MIEFLDTRQLRAFLALSRTGSFTGAARVLNLTQSAISHCIKALEEDLGFQLVQRHLKPLALTPHGQELLRHALTIEQCMRQATDGLREVGTRPLSSLSIGCANTATRYILPEVLKTFKDRYPQCEVKVLSAPCSGVMDMVIREEVDIGLLIESQDSSRIDSHQLCSDEIIFAATPGLIASGGSGNIQVQEQPLIVASRDSFTWQFVSDRLQQWNATPGQILEMGSNEAVRELALTGYGVGVCAQWILAHDLDKGSLIPVPVPGGALRREWIAATLRGRVMTSTEQIFIDLCRQSASTFTAAA